MPDILDADKFGERFTFYDLGGVLTELPLREMTPVEVLRAWRWYSDEADRICARPAQPTAAEIAAVEKAQRLGNLIKAALPDWPDGMPVGDAPSQVH